MQRDFPEDWSKTMPHAPLGSLRILARQDDAQILIVHGVDRATQSGERLAFEEWFDSIEVAKAVSHFCSARLMSIPAFGPDAEGWHPFPVHSLRTLVADAKNNLNVTFFPPALKAAPQHQAWTKERVARLAFLAGQGFTAKAIADDPLIRSTANAVYLAANRLGISLSEAPSGLMTIRLPGTVIAYFQTLAAREQLTRDAVIRRVLIGIATPPGNAAA